MREGVERREIEGEVSSSLQVFVVPPSDMLFLPPRVEAVVGTTLSLPLQVRGAVTVGNGDRSLEPFSDCRRMSLSISSSEVSVFNISVDTETGIAVYMYMKIHVYSTLAKLVV